MKKSAFFLSVVLVLMISCFSAEAATVSGEMLDQSTGLALHDTGRIDVYKFNSGTSGWDYTGGAYVLPPQTTFTISGLSAGTYYFEAYSTNYIHEYYNNKTLFENKTQVTLTASQTKSLGSIYLKPLPIRLTDCQITGSPVPAAGGTVKVKCNLVNDTAASKTVLAWTRVTPYRVLYGSTFMADALEGATKSVTVAANSKVPVTLSIAVPGDATPGGGADIFVNCGTSKWLPLMREYWVGSIYKSTP